MTRNGADKVGKMTLNSGESSPSVNLQKCTREFLLSPGLLVLLAHGIWEGHSACHWSLLVTTGH